MGAWICSRCWQELRRGEIGPAIENVPVELRGMTSTQANFDHSGQKKSPAGEFGNDYVLVNGVRALSDARPCRLASGYRCRR